MNHLQITAKCTGDKITAIAEAQEVAKAWKKQFYLEFQEGYSIAIRPDSNVQDLIQISMLETKLYEEKKKKK